MNTNQSFPGRREDFSNQQAYDTWLTREKKYLQGLMTIMVTSPTFSLNIGNEQDVGSTNLLSGRRASDSKRTSVYGNLTATDDVSSSVTSLIANIQLTPFCRVLILIFPMILDLTFVS